MLRPRGGTWHVPKVTPEEAVADWVGRCLDADARPRTIGVAVSGGGDSMALLHLVHRALRPHALAIRAVTVDHGLRDGSAAEATSVARTCASLGIPHEILAWAMPHAQGNLQEAAREARRRLIGGWAGCHGIDCVLLGHTLDDQAETVLLRLARGSGVDGLAGMRGELREAGIVWERPLLGVTREALRAWLRDQDVSWIEDPSNQDPRFDRVRARAMGEALAGLGLTRERLVRTAGHMERARRTLDEAAVAFALRHARVEGGDVVLAPEALNLEDGDSPGRVLSAAIAWVGGGRRPRYHGLKRLADCVQGGRAATLGGCRALPEAWLAGHSGLRVTREARAAEERVRIAPDRTATWDQRWRVAGPKPAEGLEVGALGDAGLAQCGDWRRTGLSRASLLGSPAIWTGETLLAAPLAGWSDGWTAVLDPSFMEVLTRS